MIYKVARRNCVTKTTKLFENWAEYCERTVGKQIFGIKVDVTDAFGTIDISKSFKMALER